MMDHLLQKCLGCAYDLTGHPEKGLCPECGRAHGDDLILVGYAKSRRNLIWMSALGSGLLLLGIFILYWSRFSGAGSFLALTVICFGGVELIRVWRLRQAMGKWGGDLRWVVSEDGIRVRRGLNTELKVLEWRGIRRIKKTRSLSFGAVRGLKVSRSFLSIDTFRYKSPPIWLGYMTKEEIIAIRDEAESKRP
jgi:hypothetical protein